jgi:hypothetical protein
VNPHLHPGIPRQCLAGRFRPFVAGAYYFNEKIGQQALRYGSDCVPMPIS